MSFEPQKFFIGLLDFFSILLPGALLTYLMMDEVGPVVLGDNRCLNLAGAEGWALFLFTSYLCGHLLFLTGSWLDEIPYDWLRQRYTLNEQIILLARRGRLLPWLARVVIWLIFKGERNLAVDCAKKIKEEMLNCLHAKDVVNTFQWSKALLAKEHPESLATVQRFEADSKFFRSFVIVLIVLVAIGMRQHQCLLASLGAVLILPALWRFMEQRLKATNQAYWSVITLTALGGKVVFNKVAPANAGPTHAGGVVFHMHGGQAKYLLVEAKKDPKEWVLPKGHIEEAEHPRETAVREVHEETGVWAKIREDLLCVSYSINGTNVRVHFFLMEYAGLGLQSDVNRKSDWFPADTAIEKASHPKAKELLKLAEERRGQLAQAKRS